MIESEIQNFYNGCNIFITGGTGFMGKILIDKLLRSTNVSKIYLLIREKKGKNAHTRLDELFDDIIFGKLKGQQTKFKNRVIAIAGDCSIPGLGLKILDREKLINNINIVFHVAATVRFDENVKISYSINVNGTMDILNLCKQMTNLKSVIHVSTAYSNCHINEIDEKFYDYPINYEEIGRYLDAISTEEADKNTKKLINGWPNTYTFTKALAEAMIKHQSQNLPIGVFRPAIVISTYNEPIRGWIDNFYGPSGVCAGVATGLLRILYCDAEVNADIVPADTCVAGIIASAWDIYNRTNKKCLTTDTNINNNNNKTIDPPIYNYVSSVENPITWGEFNILNLGHGLKNPLRNSIWAIKFNTVSNYHLYLFYRILYHMLPAILIDFASLLMGHRPRLLTMYKKIHKFSNVISFFSIRQWKFTNENTQNLWLKMNKYDRELFPLSITTVPWLLYFHSYFKGMRIYLLKDPIETVHYGKIRNYRFNIIHNIIFITINVLIILFLWSILINSFTFFLNNFLIFYNYYININYNYYSHNNSESSSLINNQTNCMI